MRTMPRKASAVTSRVAVKFNGSAENVALRQTSSEQAAAHLSGKSIWIWLEWKRQIFASLATTRGQACTAGEERAEVRE